METYKTNQAESTFLLTRLCEARLTYLVNIFLCCRISTHAPLRGATSVLADYRTTLAKFLLTRLCEARPHQDGQRNHAHKFLLTRLCEARPVYYHQSLDCCRFLLTRLCEARRDIADDIANSGHFYSRTSYEVRPRATSSKSSG